MMAQHGNVDLSLINVILNNTSQCILYMHMYNEIDLQCVISIRQLIVSCMYELPVYSPHKGPVTRKMFPFDDVIM